MNLRLPHVHGTCNMLIAKTGDMYQIHCVKDNEVEHYSPGSCMLHCSIATKKTENYKKLLLGAN
jgi:hypothetical protein